jgi:uncharacterized protein (DUF1778 family)
MSVPKKADALIENAQFYRVKPGDARRFLASVDRPSINGFACRRETAKMTALAQRAAQDQR